MIDGDVIFIGDQADGGAAVMLSGTGSHTHAPGRDIEAYKWTDVASGLTVSSEGAIACWYPFGSYTLSIEITDTVGETDSTTWSVAVAPLSDVPGTLLEAFNTSDAATLPSKPMYGEVVPEAFEVAAPPPLAGPLVFRMRGTTAFEGGPAALTLDGYEGTPQFYVDGAAVNATSDIAAGQHQLDVRCGQCTAGWMAG